VFLFLLLLLTATWQSIISVPLSFRDYLSADERRRRSGHLRRGALQNPNVAPFWQIYNSGQDDAMITFTGFDFAAFNQLHQVFQPLFDNFTPFNNCNGFIVRKRFETGRPRLLTSISCLALGLSWTRTRGSLMVLQIVFGLTRSALSVWLRFARRMIIKALINHPDAIVRLPTDDEVHIFRGVISAKYSLLTHVWGAMDGLKLTLERAGGNNDQQNNFFNGWTHDHYVTNLFVFSPDGKIRSAYFNAPGVLHDSTMAVWSSIYEQIEEVYRRTGGQVVVDSAFSTTRTQAMISSYQTNIDRSGRARQSFGLNRQATSVRQLSEWGMRGLQGSFPRLKDRFFYEERGERKLILQMVVLLYNFRASTVGQNQIQSSFMTHLLRDANHYVFSRR